MPECFCIGQLCAIAFSGFITRLACPASPRTSAQLAGFSLLASESQSLLTGRHQDPVCLIGFPRLQSLSTGLHSNFQIHYQTEKMVSVASTSATMDLTSVLPALMEGIAQEVGHSRFSKSNTTRLNGTTRSLTSFISLGLKQDAPLLKSYNTSQQQLAFDVEGSERWTNGDRPVDLYQVGSYGSCLS